jgi:ribulose-5-phosphate 4-epimerase/fuculose-1-phosphate aldolase
MAIDDDELGGLRTKLATACRILAGAGLVEDVLGHVSARLGNDHLLIRCRGAGERGLAFTTPDDVRLVAFDGDGAGEGYSVPNELAIHVETLRSRPEVGAVVHAHPPAVIAADLAGVPLLPLVGAYNIPAARLAAEGIPVYPRGVLIRTPGLAAEMLAAMGERSVCVLRGHGITTTGATIEQAVARALALDSLARMASSVVALGGVVRALPNRDLAELPDLGAGFNEALLWRHHEARLAAGGLALDDPVGAQRSADGHRR